jgi:hypothetical protein
MKRNEKKRKEKKGEEKSQMRAEQPYRRIQIR